MRIQRAGTLLALTMLLAAPTASAAPPFPGRGPVGWESYKRLDLLPYLRTGVQTRQVSSADRTGKNDDGFTGKYSCLRRVRGGCLLAEHRGAGELETIWSPGRALSNVTGVGRLRIELDGRTRVDAPMQEVVDGKLGAPFATPLVDSLKTTSGGHAINVPMPFRRSMRVIAERNPGYWQVVYRTFSQADGVSAFQRGNRAPKVFARLRRSGVADPKPRATRRLSRVRDFSVSAGSERAIATAKGPAALSTLAVRLRRLSGPPGKNFTQDTFDALRNVRLRIRFDGRRTVDAPLGEFFGSGYGPARVRALMFSMDPDPGTWMRSWFPMPFRGSAEVSLYNGSRVDIRGGEVRLSTAPSARWDAALRDGRAGYFNARGHRGGTRSGKYWTFLRTRGAGTFVGVSQTMAGLKPPYYLEGDEQAFIDGASRPQIQGTGTEDFYRGGWYWYDRLFTRPLAGFTSNLTPKTGCPRATCKSAYRLLIADAVAFRRSLDYRIEHGPENRVFGIYSSTAFWYQRR